jgi:hypothetical protein
MLSDWKKLLESFDRLPCEETNGEELRMITADNALRTKTSLSAA